MCGAVQASIKIEYSEPGWRPEEQRRTQSTGPVSRVSIGTTIGESPNQSAGRFARYNTRLRHDQESLRHGLKEIRAIAATLEATDTVKEQAAYLYRRAATEGLLVGQSIEAIAAACLHATAREEGVPFPLKQVAEVSPVDYSQIRSAYSKLVSAFDLKVAPPLPTDFIERFTSCVGLAHPIRRTAYEIAQAVIEAEDHVGQSPTGVAAAAVYGAAQLHDEPIGQKELASVAYVSVVTLSRQWQTVQSHIEEQSFNESRMVKK